MTKTIKMEIVIDSSQISKQQIKDCLEGQPEWSQSTVNLEIRKSPLRLRGIDPNVLVALVGVIGIGLGALITGLLRIVENTKTRSIVLQGKGKAGKRLEIPVDTPPEKIDWLIEKVKEMDIEHIQL